MDKYELGSPQRIEISRMVIVTDDWYGNFNGNQIRVTLEYDSFIDGSGEQTSFRANGNDDFSMYKQSDSNMFIQWAEEFKNIPNGVDQFYFENIGFISD